MKNSSIVLAAAVAMTMTACGGGGGGAAPAPSSSAPAATNSPPMISAIENQSIAQDAVSNVIGFEVRDSSSESTAISVAATSSNPDLISTDAILLSGNAAARSITFVPTPGLSGTSILTVTATDPQGASAQKAFTVNVTSESRSYREMVGTAYLKGEEVEGEQIVGYTWVDTAEEDEAAFDHFLTP